MTTKVEEWVGRMQSKL